MIGCVRLFVVRLSSVIARFEDSGILMVSKCNHIVITGETLSFFCFLTVDTRHERYKSCDYVGHACLPHLAIPCADSTAHARAQCRSSRKVHVRHRWSVSMLAILRYNGCRARGVCALESSLVFAQFSQTKQCPVNDRTPQQSRSLPILSIYKPSFKRLLSAVKDSHCLLCTHPTTSQSEVL